MNYTFTTRKALPTVSNGDTLELCNFTQAAPHTKIFEGVTGLTFKGCNLTNCDIPPDATRIDCNGGHLEYCSHLHEKWIAKGISECALECSHLVNIDIIEVDGVEVDRVYYYEDKVVE